MPSPTYDVLVAGDYCLDLIFAGLPGMPELGAEIVSKDFEMIPGGTYNSVVAMHRLGLRVGWSADFGNDPFSRFTIDAAVKEGLDTSLFVHHRQPMRRITISASYTHDRAFIAFYDPEPSVPAAFKALATASARVLYLPGLYYGRALDAGLALLHARRIPLVMDGNSQDCDLHANPAVKKAIRSAQVFMPNSLEARRLTGEDDLEKALMVLGELCPMVVVKDGSNGAYGYANGECFHAPALDVEPLDTTGAGDCFNAGFMRAWLDGRPFRECLQWGNVVGGLSTLALGGVGRVVTVENVLERLRLQS